MSAQASTSWEEKDEGSRRGKKRMRSSKRSKSGVTLIRNLSLSDSPLPDVYETHLRYSTGLAFSIVTGSADTQYFNLNGLYDPDYTGTGHQPMGFDQLAALYNRYRVISAKVELVVINTTSGVPCIISTRTTNGNPASTMDDIIESPGASLDLLAESGSGGASMFKDNRWFSCAGIAASSKSEYMSDDKYAAVVTANPSETIFYQIACNSADGSSSATLRALCRVTYRAQFYDRKTITGS